MKLRFNKIYLSIALVIFLIELGIAFIIKTGFIRYTFGDYLVVFLMYAFVRGVTNFSVLKSAIFVLCVPFIVELLQFTTFLEFFNLEHSHLAKLIFGNTFQFGDLIAYTLGIITVLLIEFNYGTAKNTFNKI